MMIVSTNIYEDASGECPYCRKFVQFIVPDFSAPKESAAYQLAKRQMQLRVAECPACRQIVIDLFERFYTEEQGRQIERGMPTEASYRVRRIFPDTPARFPPDEVKDPEIRRDYGEACATEKSSLRGAAALARRALQAALREKGFTHESKKLWQEIRVAAADPKMPSELVDKLNFLKDVGNDGAHQNYDHAGEVMDVTPEEFRMLIETLDEFFDVFYVRPARHAATMEANKARKKAPE